MIKKISLLILFISFLYSENIEIETIKNKEIFYLLEKEGYNINYQINNKELVNFFNYELNDLKFDSINSLLDNYKQYGYNYFLENKNLTFYKQIKEIKTTNNKTIKEKQFDDFNIFDKKNDFKNDYYKFNMIINNEVDSNNFINLLEVIFSKNKNVILDITFNYYKTNFNFFIYNENFEEIKKILKNNDKIIEIKENDILQENENLYLNLVLEEFDKSIKNYETLLLTILNNNNINKNYFPYYYGKIKFFNDNYIYLKNINNDNFEKYVDKYNKIYELKNEKTFKNFSNTCYLQEKNIICENNNYIIKY